MRPIGPEIGGTYNPTTGAVTATGTSPSAGPDPDAFAYLVNILNSYGLGDLAQWAWGELVAGKTQSQVILDLYGTQQFKDAFPEIGLRQQNGLPPVSVADVLNYRDSAAQIFHAAGLPADYWKGTDLITQAIAGDVSLNELQQRVQNAAYAVNQMPDAVKDAALRYYGMTAGDWARSFLDLNTPEDKLAQQLLAAQIGGAGTLAGYGASRTSAERLAGEGVSYQQASQGFGDLAHKRQLFEALPGEQGYQPITEDQQIGAEFEQNATAQQRIEMEARRRVALFQDSGSFGTSQQGYTGLGVAQ